jgi:hypothetical protein
MPPAGWLIASPAAARRQNLPFCAACSWHTHHRPPAHTRRYACFMPVIGGPRTEQAFTLSNGPVRPRARRRTILAAVHKRGLLEPILNLILAVGSLRGSLTTRSLERS